MNYWFTADYHLGHANIIKYCDRPFRDLDQMNSTIIRNHNSRVKAEDTVFHLGDFCFKNSSDVKGEGVRIPVSEWEAQLNGKIIHVRGNHDKNNSTKTIIQGMLIRYGAKDVYCVHNPQHYNSNYPINFVGHAHENWVIGKVGRTLLINVGVDVNRFMPRLFAELIGKINKAKKLLESKEKFMFIWPDGKGFVL